MVGVSNHVVLLLDYADRTYHERIFGLGLYEHLFDMFVPFIITVAGAGCLVDKVVHLNDGLRLHCDMLYDG